MKLAEVALTLKLSPLTMPANVAPALLTVAVSVASYVLPAAVMPLTLAICACVMVPVPVPVMAVRL